MFSPRKRKEHEKKQRVFALQDAMQEEQSQVNVLVQEQNEKQISLAKLETKQESQDFKIFDLYDMNEIKVTDETLKPYINIEGKLLIKSQGRNEGKFSAAKVHVVERLVNRVAVPGHIGKKHKIITARASGKYTKNMKIVLGAFEIIQKKKFLKLNML